MNYQEHYNRLINRGKTRHHPDCYTEEHHIIPRCIGGSNYPENMVKLTPEEHYVAHQLLIKLYSGNRKYKLAHGAKMMTVDSNGRRVNNKLQGWLKRLLSEAKKNRIWITNEIDSRIINKDDPIPDGWRRGSHYKSLGATGLIWIKNETHSLRIPATDDIPDGWELGRFDSTTKDTIWINNGQESRMIPKDESIPEGWSKGYHFNTNEDKIYITNGFESKMIPKDDPLPDGWRRGNHHKNVAGYIWITNEIDSKRIPETESIPDGWRRGRAKFKSKSSS